jgi:predicted PurR-regulated permease PerM
MADDGQEAAEEPGGAPHPAAAATPVPAPDRGTRLSAALRRLAIGSAQLLLVVGAVVVVGWVAGRLWVVLLPVVLGLLFTTVLWPPVRFLRRHSWPPALAAATVLLLFIAAIGGVIALIAPQLVTQASDVANAATGGLQQVRTWLEGPPFDVGEDQIGSAVDSVITSLQNNARNIAGYALSAVTTVGNGLLNLVLALVLCFFFLKDGPRWVPWVAAQTGARSAPHVAALSEKGWATLSSFVRQQAFVGFIDAFFIGLGLLVMGVPLVVPLAVITFFGAFVPIIGAFVAGAFAVLIALVSNGFTTAVIILAVVVAVQQLEGNVLQPIIQGRGLNLHAAVVILAVTAGSSLAGIIGAFLAVPVTALVAVAYRYARDVLDGRSPEIGPDGVTARLVPAEHGVQVVQVVHEQSASPATPDGGAHATQGRLAGMTRQAGRLFRSSSSPRG